VAGFEAAASTDLVAGDDRVIEVAEIEQWTANRVCAAVVEDIIGDGSVGGLLP